MKTRGTDGHNLRKVLCVGNCFEKEKKTKRNSDLTQTLQNNVIFLEDFLGLCKNMWNITLGLVKC